MQVHGLHSGVTYPEAAVLWETAGWTVLPLVPGRNGSPVPPTGATGRRGVDSRWSERDTTAVLAMAVRVPAGVVDLDVDSHGGRSDDAEASLVELGPLPPTMRSTSRGSHPTSGQYFYRWPGMPDRLKRLPGIDVLHRGCGFSRVWPSTSDKTGEQYRLYWGAPGAGSVEIQAPLYVSQLAEIPAAAAARLQQARSAPVPPALAWNGAPRSSRESAREVAAALGLVFIRRGWASMCEGNEYSYPPSESGGRSALRRDDGWWHIYSGSLADALGIADEAPFSRGFDDQSMLDAAATSGVLPVAGEKPPWAPAMCECEDCLRYR